MRVVLTMALGLLAAACGASGTGAGASSGAPEAPDGVWELTSGSRLVPGWPITLTIDGADAGGRAACNGYFGSVQIDGSALVFSALGATDMGCEPDVMAAESGFFRSLGGVDQWAIASGRLLLSGPDVSLTFDPVPEVPTAELVGTTWTLEGLVSGEAVRSPDAGTTATLRLDADGTLVGGTGCRDLSGRWIEAGGEVVFTDFAAEGECPGQHADQDGFVVTVLGDGFRAEIEGDRLTVTSVGGEGLQYRAG